MTLSTGLTFQRIKDNAMSPVKYLGTLPTLSFGFLKEKQARRLTELYLPVQYAKIHSRQVKEYATMKGNMFRLDLDYVYLLNTGTITDSAKGQFYIGGSLHTFLDVRYLSQLDNSAILYDNFNSIAISAAYKHSFRLNSKILQHFHRVSVPFLSYGTRPDYMNLYDITDPSNNDLLKDALSHSRICSFGSFSRIIIRNCLFYPIRGRNLLSLTYEWQYFTATFTERIKAGSHSILLSLLVNI